MQTGSSPTAGRIAGLRLGDHRAHALLQALFVFRFLPAGSLDRDLRGLLAGLVGRDAVSAGQMATTCDGCAATG